MPLTAQEQYQQRTDEIDGLIRDLQYALERHSRCAKVHPTDWGYAGDLTSIRDGLSRLCESLQGEAFDVAV